MKVEERTGDAPGTAEQVKARLIAAFPKARVTPSGDRLLLTVLVHVTRARRIALDVEFGAPAESRVPVRLRGFGFGRTDQPGAHRPTGDSWPVISGRTRSRRPASRCTRYICTSYGPSVSSDPNEPPYSTRREQVCCAASSASFNRRPRLLQDRKITPAADKRRLLTLVAPSHRK
jgi:hypothetical protein